MPEAESNKPRLDTPVTLRHELYLLWLDKVIQLMINVAVIFIVLGEAFQAEQLFTSCAYQLNLIVPWI